MKGHASMKKSQGNENAQWTLAPGEVRSLRIGPGPRLLQVAQGSVWLTSQGSPQAPPEDVWLGAGDSVALDDAAKVVIEGWPQARFQLLVPPCTRAPGRPLISAWLSGLRAA